MLNHIKHKIIHRKIRSALIINFKLFLQLFGQGLRAIARPHRAFKELPEKLPLPRKTLAIFLGLGGLVFVTMHFGIAQGRLLLQYPLTDLVHIVFMPIMSVWIWLAGSLLFFIVARLLGRKVSLGRLEVAAFYLWCVWFIMPIFDLPHLLYGLPFVTILGVGAHASWLFGFTWLPLMSFFLVRDLIGLNGFKQKVATLGLAVAIPFIGRYGVENSPRHIDAVLRLLGIQLGYSRAAFIAGPALFTAVLLAWLYVFKQFTVTKSTIITSIKYTSGAMAILAFTVIGTAKLLDQTNIPIQLGQNIDDTPTQIAADNFDNGYSRYTNSHTWAGPDYEGGTQGYDSGTNQANYNAAPVTYTDSVDLDFDPTQATITAVRCNVNFSTVVNWNTGDAPRAHCDIQPDATGTWQQGAWQSPTATGTRTWTWNNPTWGGDLRQNNNSVRVWLNTTWDGNANEPHDGDQLFYDSVTLEIDYEADITQTDYRWYGDSNAPNPNNGLANQNTPATGIYNGQPLRLRAAMQVDTGWMDVNTENFELQFAEKTGASCSSIGVWANVGAIGSATTWRFVDAGPGDGQTLGTSRLGSYVAMTYSESNPTPNNSSELNPSTPTGEWDWALENNGAPPNTSYCFRIREAGGPALDTYSVYPELTTEPLLWPRQAAERWFENTDDTTAGNDLGSQDASVYAPFDGASFRLRMLVDVTTDGGLQMSAGQSYKLQYAQMSGSCDTSFTGESYMDVSPSSGAIRFYNNPTPADGATATANAGDPSYSGHNVVYQTYVETNPFASINTTLPGESALWDFSLVDFSANQGVDYCFRIVKSDGSPLEYYSRIPQITTVGTLTVQAVDSTGTPIASPSIALNDTTAQFECQRVYGGYIGVSGDNDMLLRVHNGQPNAGWTLSIAATDGNTALWSGNEGSLYDFNDTSGTPAGCINGLDGDMYGGLLYLDTSASATTTAYGGCDPASNISYSGVESSFEQNEADSLVIASGNASVPLFCYYDITDVAFSQQIPAETPPETYSLNLTITLLAN